MNERAPETMSFADRCKRYDKDKAEWVKANRDADHKQIEQAMRDIAKKWGV